MSVDCIDVFSSIPKDCIEVFSNIPYDNGCIDIYNSVSDKDEDREKYEDKERFDDDEGLSDEDCYDLSFAQIELTDSGYGYVDYSTQGASLNLPIVYSGEVVEVTIQNYDPNLTYLISNYMTREGDKITWTEGNNVGNTVYKSISIGVQNTKGCIKISKINVAPEDGFGNVWEIVSSDEELSGTFMDRDSHWNSKFRNRLDILEFRLIKLIDSMDDFYLTWNGCSNMEVFEVSEDIDTSQLTKLSGSWWNCPSLTSFPLINTSNVTYMSSAWSGCPSLTSFPLIDTSNVLNLQGTWNGCTSLTSFPSINTSSVVAMGYTWYGCSSLTSFPLIDTSSVTNMDRAWYGCSSLTSFPLIDTSSVTNMDRAWYGCSSLTSFSYVDVSSITTNCNTTWGYCSSLTSHGGVSDCSKVNTYSFVACCGLYGNGYNYLPCGLSGQVWVHLCYGV